MVGVDVLVILLFYFGGGGDREGQIGGRGASCNEECGNYNNKFNDNDGRNTTMGIV